MSYNDEYSRFSGGGDRFSAMLKMSPSPGSRNGKPKDMAYQNYNKLKRSSAPAIGDVLKWCFIGLIGLFAIKVFKAISGAGASIGSIFGSLFGGSASTTPSSNIYAPSPKAADSSSTGTFVSPQAVSAISVKNSSGVLNGSVTNTQASTDSSATALWNMMNCALPDQSGIVSYIQDYDYNTFQGINASYGTRLLTLWYVWRPWDDLFGAKDATPIDLKDSLNLVLSSDNLSEISDYTDLI